MLHRQVLRHELPEPRDFHIPRVTTIGCSVGYLRRIAFAIVQLQRGGQGVNQIAQ